MAFQNPFPGLSTPLNTLDLVRALRIDLAAEEEAIHLYTAHADATDNEIVAGALLDIADEEKVHAGEIIRLIDYLDPGESKLLEKGAAEIEKKFPEIRYLPGGVPVRSEA
jgi:rubrerythrin